MEQISINNNPVSTETWYKGKIEKDDKQYDFWFIVSEDYTLGKDDNISYTVDWWYKPVPREIRKLEPDIIKHFEQSLKSIE